MDKAPFGNHPCNYSVDNQEFDNQRRQHWITVLGYVPLSSPVNIDYGMPAFPVSPQPIVENGPAPSQVILPQPQTSSPMETVPGPTTRTQRSSSRTADRRPFRCDVCDTRYVQRGDMVRHIRCVHEGLRPYVCHLCGNSFGRRSILNKHIQRHENKKDGRAKCGGRGGKGGGSGNNGGHDGAGGFDWENDGMGGGNSEGVGGSQGGPVSLGGRRTSTQSTSGKRKRARSTYA